MSSASESTSRRALREVLHLLLRLLDGDDPEPMLAPGGPLRAALAAWRNELRAGEEGDGSRLQLVGRLAEVENDRDTLRTRNTELLEEVLQLNQRLQAGKQEQVEMRLQASSARNEARHLDLEVRDLKRRLRQLEGGVPLTAEEAAPSSTGERETVADQAMTQPPEPSLAELQEALRRSRQAAAERASAARAALEAVFTASPAEEKGAPKTRPARKRKKKAVSQPRTRQRAASDRSSGSPSAARRPRVQAARRSRGKGTAR